MVKNIYSSVKMKVKPRVSKQRQVSKKDEFYTPKVAVEILLPYLEKLATKLSKKPIIWCPFDTVNSEYVKVFAQNGYQVVNSHIADGQDFFSYEPDNWDILVSNPPFSLKNEIIQKCFNLGKPWALLQGIGFLDYVSTFNLLEQNKFEISLLFMKGRVSYDGNGISFGSIYIASKNFFPQQLNFSATKNKNTGKDFVQSSMEKDRKRIALFLGDEDQVFNNKQEEEHNSNIEKIWEDIENE